MADYARNHDSNDRTVPGGFSNRKATGQLPNPLPNPLRLNLGCGNDVRNGFVNIDLFSSNPDVVGMDIRQLELDDSTADLILASDILEHFSHRETDYLLREWARVLKPGGQIIVRCPSLRLQAEAYLRGDWDADIASYMIFGGQTNPGDFHCNGFDKVTIEKHLTQAGLVIISTEEHNFPQTNGYINLNMTVKAIKPEIGFAGKGFNQHFLDPIDIPEVKTEQPSAAKSEFNGFSFGADSTPVSYEKVKPLQSENKTGLNIVWEGSQFIYHSLALINREHCHNIIQSGVANVTIIPYENDTFSPEGNAKYMLLKENDIRFKEEVPKDIAAKPYVWIRHQWPPKFDAPQGAKWIIMQPWEYSRLRKDFVQIFNQADEIWTPSTFCRNSFVASGVEPNKVQVIPNGIIPDLYKPSNKILDLKTKKRFKFLFVGGTIFRKGIDILLQAYVKAFTSTDDVCLVIKDFGGDSFYKGQTAKQAIEKIRERADAPEIVYIDTIFSEDEMPALYNSCDVYVSTYRGEGFSLPTLEAMACGLPVIVTKGGSTDDFVDESVGWLIDAEPRLLGDKIDNHPIEGDAFLLEPNREELESVLKDIYEDPRDVFIKGMIAQYRARKHFTWNRSTLKLLSRLDCLFGTRMAFDAELTLTEMQDAYIYLGEAEYYLSIKQSDIALEFFENALNLGGLMPKHHQHILLRIAEIMLKNGNIDQADDYAAKAAMLSFDSCDEKYICSGIFAARGETVDALEYITPAMDNWRNLKFSSTLGIGLDDLLCRTADLLRTIGDLEGAYKLYTTCLEINNENANACYGSALSFIEAGMDKEAITMLEWAIKLDPENTKAIEELDKLNEKM